MNKKLQHTVLTGLFLLGSAGVWMACDCPEKKRKEAEAAAAAAAKLNIEKIENAKFTYLNTGNINYSYGSGAHTHEFQMATFELPNESINLVIPFPKQLMPNTRHRLEYEVLDKNKPYTAQDFANRFLKKKNCGNPELAPNFVLDKNLDGILLDITPYESLR